MIKILCVSLLCISFSMRAHGYSPNGPSNSLSDNSGTQFQPFVENLLKDMEKFHQYTHILLTQLGKCELNMKCFYDEVEQKSGELNQNIVWQAMANSLPEKSAMVSADQQCSFGEAKKVKKVLGNCIIKLTERMRSGLNAQQLNEYTHGCQKVALEPLVESGNLFAVAVYAEKDKDPTWAQLLKKAEGTEQMQKVQQCQDAMRGIMHLLE